MAIKLIDISHMIKSSWFLPSYCKTKHQKFCKFFGANFYPFAYFVVLTKKSASYAQ